MVTTLMNARAISQRRPRSRGARHNVETASSKARGFSPGDIWSPAERLTVRKTAQEKVVGLFTTLRTDLFRGPQAGEEAHSVAEASREGEAYPPRVRPAFSFPRFEKDARFGRICEIVTRPGQRVVMDGVAVQRPLTELGVSRITTDRFRTRRST